MSEEKQTYDIEAAQAMLAEDRARRERECAAAYDQMSRKIAQQFRCAIMPIAQIVDGKIVARIIVQAQP